MCEKLRNSDEKFCSSCGETINLRAEICPKCGVRQIAAAGDSKKTVVGIVALLLGGLGIHKFMLGKPIQGILYILFCWTFIPAAIAFIEGLIYLTMSEEKFAEKYC